ncbi:MAG: pyridoxine 5'-phosphate synthase [Candidatus Sumerlaeia bacterium]|nr:pyridoxine 5'-phosphate synthase [Candidatus Sumerlaeia bacterium]
MIRLSVNVNKIATLRNSRGGQIPDPVRFSRAAIAAGAHGITVHPRPDERHIRRTDVFAIREVIAGDIEYNIEGYPDERYMQIVAEARPHQATLVPDPPDVITSNAGWDVVEHRDYLRDVVARLKEMGCRVSLFLEPDEGMVEAAAATGADRIELYTEAFARAHAAGRGLESFAQYTVAARRAVKVGLGINAGHDLNLQNLPLLRTLPGLLEVSIGHYLVRDALLLGWEATIRSYLDALNPPATEPPAH